MGVSEPLMRITPLAGWSDVTFRKTNFHLLLNMDKFQGLVRIGDLFCNLDYEVNENTILNSIVSKMPAPRVQYRAVL